MRKVILFLNISPKMIDINIHPSKSEVKFQNPKMISKYTILGLENALNAKSNIRILHDNYHNKDDIKNKYNFLNVRDYIYKYSLGIAKAQINNTYIVSEKNNALILIDKYAAYKFIVYEIMKRSLKKNGIKSKKLVFFYS